MSFENAKIREIVLEFFVLDLVILKLFTVEAGSLESFSAF